MFLELHKKCENGEISSKALDLRGLLGAVGLMEKDLIYLRHWIWELPIKHLIPMNRP